MTRERIAGFLLGISIGIVTGFFLRPAQANPPEQAGKLPKANDKSVAGDLRSIGDRTAVRRGHIASAGSAF